MCISRLLSPSRATSLPPHLVPICDDAGINRFRQQPIETISLAPISRLPSQTLLCAVIRPKRSRCQMEHSNSSVKALLLNHTINASLEPNPDHTVSDEPFTTQQLIRIFTVTIVVYPILLTFCTVGNILSFVVLIREKRKGSTNIYMTSMVISDFFIL